MEQSEVLPEDQVAVQLDQRLDVQLDQRLDALADNVYGTLVGAPSPVDIVVRLRRLGWSARKASWLEFACTVPWCELLLTPVEDDELTVSGVVDPDRLDDLAQALAAAGTTGHLELYDGDGRLTGTVPVSGTDT